LKAFAKQIGIANSAKLRKDELEALIKHYIKTGNVTRPRRKNMTQIGAKDYELGLKLSMPIQHYTSNKQTKQFIETEALKLNPQLKKKSGARYRLNRWREEQLNAGKQITYGDLVAQYIKLNESTELFERIPHGRYINFISDFLASEKNVTRTQAICAWELLKQLDIPKDYLSWKSYHKSKVK
jgi:hypothetical protein